MAIKIICKKNLKEKPNWYLLEQLLTEEMRLLTLIEHPHIVRTLGLASTEESIYVAFELISSGNLLEFLKQIKQKHISFTEADAANLVKQILLAIAYLHSPDVNVIHRDLKLENIMVDIEKESDGKSKIVCKVTDFGFSVAMDPSGKQTLALGTPTYMAPEIV